MLFILAQWKLVLPGNTVLIVAQIVMKLFQCGTNDFNFNLKQIRKKDLPHLLQINFVCE